jgi:hypothetical protein
VIGASRAGFRVEVANATVTIATMQRRRVALRGERIEECDAGKEKR